MKFMRVPRTAVVTAAFIIAASGMAGAAALLAPTEQPATRPAGQVVQEQVLPQAEEVEVTAETTSTSTGQPSTTPPGTVPVMTEQPPAHPPAPADEPAETTTPVETTVPVETTEPAIHTPSPQPQPTVRCRMDDSDPVTYPNGREVCETVVVSP